MLRSKLFFALLPALLFGLILNAVGQTVAAPPADDPPPGLFIDAGAAPSGDVHALGRSRLVKIDLAQFGGEGADGSGQGLANPSATLHLNLFENADFTATLERVEAIPSGGFIWIGRLPGVDLSQALFLVKDGLVVGDIRMPSAAYGIEWVGEGVYRLRQEVGQARREFQDDVVRRPLGAKSASPPPSLSPLGRDDGSIIDLLVGYTALARQQAGGKTAIEARIEAGVAQLNAALQNSGITPRVRLVKKLEVNYTESGSIDTDLDCLMWDSCPPTGDLSGLNDERNQANADLVSLIIGGPIGQDGTTGMADMPDLSEPHFGGFSVVFVDYITQEMTLAHEIGHNLGGDHDWFVNWDEAPGYAKGYVNVARRWTTVMAYPDLCWNKVNDYCPPIPYFSNPEVAYQGAPTGVPVGTNQSCQADNPNNPPCDADNRRAINEWAEFVANYRYALDPARFNVIITTDPSPVLTSTTGIWFGFTISNVGDMPATVPSIQIMMPVGGVEELTNLSFPAHQSEEVFWFYRPVTPGSLHTGDILVTTVNIECSDCPNAIPPITLFTIVNPKQTFLPLVVKK